MPQNSYRSSQHLWGRRIQQGLRSVGIRVLPFFMVRENENPGAEIPLPDNCEFREYFAGDIDLLTRSRGDHVEEGAYRERFDTGVLCFGLQSEDRVMAVIWCNPNKITGLLYPCDLDEETVYLFDAYSHPDFRGNNLAPALRQRIYGELSNRGIRSFCSITEYFNSQARRFKEKLGARNEWLGAWIGFRNRGRSFVIWRYRQKGG